MKSRISIDVDSDNQPIIKLEYMYSEDVRDKLVKKFLETFGISSVWARADFQPDFQKFGTKETVTTLIVRPISPQELSLNAISMTSMGKESDTHFGSEQTPPCG